MACVFLDNTKKKAGLRKMLLLKTLTTIINSLKILLKNIGTFFIVLILIEK
jgi:hypothetical protein